MTTQPNSQHNALRCLSDAQLAEFTAAVKSLADAIEHLDGIIAQVVELTEPDDEFMDDDTEECTDEE